MRRSGDGKSPRQAPTARSRGKPFLASPDPAGAADRPVSPGEGLPARLACASSRASRDSRDRRPPGRRVASAAHQPPRTLPPPDGSARPAKYAATAASASDRASTRFSARPSAIGSNCPSTATVHRKRFAPGPRVADAATGTTIWADHQLGARANGPPLRRLGDGSDRLPFAEFLSELPDALGAAFRDQDRDLAQPLRPQGSGWAPKRLVSHGRADTRHQSSRRSNRTERARRSCQCAV